jgi:hypothetical protein
MRKFCQILSVFLLLLEANLCAQNIQSYSSSSVLSSGVWFRIAVTSDGIYRIDYSKLKQLGLVNPSNPRIFGNNAGQLSYYNDDPKPDDLREISIYTSTGQDGIFNEGDYLLFFGKATHRWNFDNSANEYSYLRHNYSDTAFYFITSGPASGKQITESTETSLAENYSSMESDVLFVHEQENINLIKSGREWFQQVSATKGIGINPFFKDLLTGEKLKYTIRVAARASKNTSFMFYEGSSLKKSIPVTGVNLQNSTGTYAQIVTDTGSFNPLSESPVFEIRFNNGGESSAGAWLDFVQLQGRRSNVFSGSFLQFSDSRTVSEGRITMFSIRNLPADAVIWDISDPFNSSLVTYERAGDNAKFKLETESLRTFIAFTPGNAQTPVIFPAPVPNQDLHSSGPAEMIIVTHPLFKTYAEKLGEIHLSNSDLITGVVTPQQIYNEFSGGIPDIAAIRNYLRMKYLKQKGTDLPLKYLLLFGDGSYENKTPPPGNPNFVPTYQSQNSNIVVSSFTSDDFYGLLGDGEGESQGTEVIGIGRLPVSDTVQAGNMLLKIERYLSPANTGEWKNIICFAADDEDGNTHMVDAEGLSSIIETNYPAFNLSKIYLDAFRQTASVSGQTYPEVNKAISDRINAGCLIFNYTGHGNEIGLASEGVVTADEINSWQNMAKLPLFITATCEFSRFDDVDIDIMTRKMTGKNSAGEKVLLNRDGGGIALMSTTRVVYSAPNYFLNRNIFNAAFERDSSGNSMRLGDIIRIAKNNSGNGSNKRNFTLLGDPALKLAYPWHGKVITDSINNIHVEAGIDTLKALSILTVAGHIEDPKGNLMSSFNGIVYPLVFDKSSKVKTLANDGGETLEFNSQNSILFSGKTMVKEGRFRFTFIVPRDIDYSFGTGKISYYASNMEEDMSGFFNIIAGGFSNTINTDTTGPDIKLYMNDTLFKNGGITDKRPRLLAIIEDSGGINTTGTGIGHDITGFLDNDPKNSFVLNNYFEYDLDTYTRGSISYDLSEISEGSHTFTLKAWDNFNNSSENILLFLVETDGKFILRNLINYPNPFLAETRITAGHNRPENELIITIKIYNLNGMTVKIIKTKVPSSGYTIPEIIWDGNNDKGSRAGRGIYPYTVTVTTDKGETARSSGRMIIL